MKIMANTKKDRYIVQYTSDSKFQEPLVADFSPASLKALKGSHTGGELQYQHALFSAMLQEWDCLRKDVSTMQNAASTLQYKAMPYCEDGKEPTPEAVKVAECVNNALWRRCEMKPGVWEQNFQTFLGSVYHAILRGVQVHEILWDFDGDMWFPRAYLPVMPQFYGWSYQTGQPDRLLLYKDGNCGVGEGEEFPRDRFVVALNNQGPDHPLFNATLFSLVGHFASARWSVNWMREYAQIFGKPFRVFHVESDKDKAKLEEELASKPVLKDIVYRGEKDSVQIVAAPANGTAMPQKVLYDMAERACHKQILGQTLTSDTGEHGGSLAQAKVHAGVMQDEVLAVGNFICDVLNAQLIPAIVQRNYGRTDVPMPEMRCSIPNCAKNEAQADFYVKLVKELGLPLKKADLYEVFGQTPPTENDEVIGADHGKEDGKGKPEREEGKPEKEGKEKPAEKDADDGKERETENERLTAAKAEDGGEDDAIRALVLGVYKDWTSPVAKRLEQALREGAGPDEIKRLISEGELKPDTEAVARLFAAGMMNGKE